MNMYSSFPITLNDKVSSITYMRTSISGYKNENKEFVLKKIPNVAKMFIALFILLIGSIIVNRIQYNSDVKEISRVMDKFEREHIIRLHMTDYLSSSDDIAIGNRELIDQIQASIFECDWQPVRNMYLGYDGYPYYNFTIIGNSDISNISLYGKNFIHLSYTSHRDYISKRITLKVDWSDADYDHFVELIEESKTLDLK